MQKHFTTNGSSSLLFPYYVSDFIASSYTSRHVKKQWHIWHIGFLGCMCLKGFSNETNFNLNSLCFICTISLEKMITLICSKASCESVYGGKNNVLMLLKSIPSLLFPIWLINLECVTNYVLVLNVLTWF